MASISGIPHKNLTKSQVVCLLKNTRLYSGDNDDDHCDDKIERLCRMKNAPLLAGLPLGTRSLFRQNINTHTQRDTVTFTPKHTYTQTRESRWKSRNYICMCVRRTLDRALQSHNSSTFVCKCRSEPEKPVKTVVDGSLGSNTVEVQDRNEDQWPSGLGLGASRARRKLHTQKQKYVCVCNA